MKKLKTDLFHRIMLVIGTVLLCLMVVSTASAEQDSVRFPLPSPFIPALESNGVPRYTTAPEIEKQIRKYSKEFKKLYWNRAEIKRFIIPSHAWLNELLDFYLYYLEWNQIEGKTDIWDCENFSSLLNSFATIRIWKAGFYDTRGAIGWMRVDAKEEWAGLPGVMHALMFAVTEDGLLVIEPQNGESVELADYPNRFYIQEVFLF